MTIRGKKGLRDWFLGCGYTKALRVTRSPWFVANVME